jgi:hypothetical protein
MADDVIIARRKLCLKMAEIIDDVCDDLEDVDELAKAIDMALPMTYVEAEAEMEKLRDDTCPPRQPGPSKLRQIAELVHCTEDMSIATVLDAVIAKLKEPQLPTTKRKQAAALAAEERGDG